MHAKSTLLRCPRGRPPSALGVIPLLRWWVSWRWRGRGTVALCEGAFLLSRHKCGKGTIVDLDGEPGARSLVWLATRDSGVYGTFFARGSSEILAMASSANCRKDGSFIR